MKHIKSRLEGEYCAVVLDGYEGEVESHPSVIDYPEFYEVVDGPVPEDCKYFVNFVSDKPQTLLGKIGSFFGG